MSISGIYALTNQTTDGTFSTGIVDIKIETYKLDSENQEVKYDDTNKTIMPGDEISIIPKVSNLGANCYVRLKVDYIDENTDFSNYITGFSDNLKKYGDYYYYNGVLKSDETIKIFETIRIPENITNNENIELNIIAEAIQEKNFEPDYTLADPWKNNIPTESINNSYNLNNNAKITIKYENGTNTDISVSNNFFEKLKDIMPGDSFEDDIEIKNISKEKAKYYLRLETDENSTKEAELLNQVNLTITNNDGKVLYNGKLLSKDDILLGEYNLNDYDKLKFKISVTNELGNEYALLNPEIFLIFSSEYDENDIVKDNIEKVNDDEEKVIEDKEIVIEDNINKTNPKTGDSIVLSIIIFFISAIGLVIVMLLWHRENKK